MDEVLLHVLAEDGADRDDPHRRQHHATHRQSGRAIAAQDGERLYLDDTMAACTPSAVGRVSRQRDIWRGQTGPIAIGVH